MNVSEMLERKGNTVFSLAPDQSVRAAVAVFAGENIGAMLVLDADSRLVGIVSERDLVRSLHESGGNMLDRPIGELMTRSVVTCAPGATIADAVALMGTHRIRHLPVVGDGKILGLISIRDVLESQLETQEEHFAALVRAKQEAALARRAAEMSNRAKSEFLADISHELTRPLGTIVDLAEYLGDESYSLPQVPQCAPYLREIEDSGRHVLKALENLVDLSRLQIGALRPADEILAIPEVVADCVAAIAERAERKGLTLDIAAAGDLPELVADQSLVRRVLDNLLDNAVKFTPDGGTVTITAALGRDGDIRVAVDDTGIGIAAEALAEITQPFGRRGHKSASLGLALVDAIARAHGGMLDIQSRVGIGTSATLRFPAARTVAFPHELDESADRAEAAA